METNNSQAVITLPDLHQQECKHITTSLLSVLNHALSADNAVESIGTDVLTDYFYVLHCSVNAIPVCTE